MSQIQHSSKMSREIDEIILRIQDKKGVFGIMVFNNEGNFLSY